MASVEVFNFSFYNVTTDKIIRSRRMGQRDAITLIRGIVVEGTGVSVNAPDLNSEIYGLTKIDYVPVPYN